MAHDSSVPQPTNKLKLLIRLGIPYQVESVWISNV